MRRSSGPQPVQSALNEQALALNATSVVEALRSSARVGGWEPALSGVDGERALDWAVRLAEELRWARAQSADPSLAGGAAGLAVLFAFLARTLGDRRYDESVQRYLRLAGETPTGGLGRCGVGLYQGLAGVAWAESLIGRLNGSPPPPSDDVDELLGEVLDRGWRGSWGLARGLVGVGVYGLERSASDPRLLNLVLEQLVAAPTAMASSGDLGMAEGLSGLVAFAALIAAAGRGQELLTDATGVMLARAPELGGRPHVPAWCDSDMGAAASLALAGPFLGHPLVPQTLTRVLEGIPLGPGSAGARDMGICHGVAGVAHALHRVSVATGQSRVRQATQAWAQALLQGLDDGERCPQSGLLEGTAGVVLVLLSLATDVEPLWDRMLLLS